MKAGSGMVVATMRTIGLWPAIIASLTASCPGQAASQGAAEIETIGTIRIIASVAGQMQIKGLSDVTLTAGGSGSAAAQSVCVWSNSLNRGYSLAALGSGVGGTFDVVNATDALPYSVVWHDVLERGTGAELRPGETLAGFTATATAASCGPASTSTPRLIVSISHHDVESLTRTAAYSGVLSLVIVPT